MFRPKPKIFVNFLYIFCIGTIQFYNTDSTPRLQSTTLLTTPLSFLPYAHSTVHCDIDPIFNLWHTPFFLGDLQNAYTHTYHFGRMSIIFCYVRPFCVNCVHSWYCHFLPVVYNYICDVSIYFYYTSVYLNKENSLTCHDCCKTGPQVVRFLPEQCPRTMSQFSDLYN